MLGQSISNNTKKSINVYKIYDWILEKRLKIDDFYSFSVNCYAFA